jgi:phosphohistidine phosphatase
LEALILLLRHGQAKSKEEDPQRGLTDAGRSEVARVAEALRSLFPPPDAIWHSGKLRAEQTARILAQALGAEERLRAHTGLDPDDPAASSAAEVQAYTGKLAVVGHLPHLYRLISLLLIGKEAPELFQLPASGALCLQRDQGLWRVRWMLTPETCLR